MPAGSTGSTGATGATGSTDSPGPIWPRASALVDWFCRVDVPDTEAKMFELVMSGQLVAHSKKWIAEALERTPPFEAWLEEARAQRRPLFWYVPAIEGQHMILPHLLDRYFELGVLADPEMHELLARRFVSVKCPAGGELAQRFGLHTPGFMQPGFLVLSPEGEELLRVERIFTFQAQPFAARLREVLAEQGSQAANSEAFRRAQADWKRRSDVESGERFLDEALRDGELSTARELATELAERAPDVAAHARTRLARLDADIEGATEALAAWTSEESDARRYEQARLALGREAFDEAEPMLRQLHAKGGVHSAEAGYHLGCVQYLTQRDDEAYATWSRIAQDFPQTSWGMRADAHRRIGSDGLRGESPLLRAMARPGWSRALDPATGTRSAYGEGNAPGTGERALVENGLRFLLQQQRAAGLWLGSRWGGDGETVHHEPIGEGPGTFSNIHTAISALCAIALHAWRDVAPEEVDAALERAETYLLRDDLVVRGDTTAWVYADAFRLLYVTRAYPDPKTRPESLHEAARIWIDELLAHQDEIGGSFRHYPYTSTFVTAMVVLCLLEAEEHGFEIPFESFELACEKIEGARGGEHELFGYLLDSPSFNRTLAGAACRQALCVLALYRCGRTDEADLDRSLELFLGNYASAVEPPRKSNFHMPSLDGSAGYFFFHNFLATSMAARASARAKEFTTRLVQHLLELPEIDGTFVDAGFSYGKNYGTAAALTSLAILRAEG